MSSVQHYENFPVASWLIPKRQRHPVTIIYHYLRSADDIADEGDADTMTRIQQLDTYADQLHRIQNKQRGLDPLFQHLSTIISQYQLSITPFLDVLRAFKRDQTQLRYASREELLSYCQDSANPVGRIMLDLFYPQHAQKNPAWQAQSDAICTALQLINHWQDVVIDWRKGRVYIPQDQLAYYGVAESQLANGVTNAAWRQLMSAQVRHAAHLMCQGATLPCAMTGRFAWELRLIVLGGLRIAEKLQRCGYDVFRQRPTLNAYDWSYLLWRITHYSRYITQTQQQFSIV
jgi:squalene synthase HpnC